MKERLKHIRKTKGLTQKGLADLLGIAQATVGFWESGRDPIPATRIYQICNELHVRREWLVSGEGEMFAEADAPFDKEQAQREFVLQVFKSLDDKHKAIILKALEDYLEEHGLSPVKTQTNNGTVSGDMIQN